MQIKSLRIKSYRSFRIHDTTPADAPLHSAPHLVQFAPVAESGGNQVSNHEKSLCAVPVGVGRPVAIFRGRAGP